MGDSHMVDASNVTMSRFQALCCTQDSSLLLNPYTDNKNTHNGVMYHLQTQ